MYIYLCCSGFDQSTILQHRGRIPELCFVSRVTAVIIVAACLSPNLYQERDVNVGRSAIGAVCVKLWNSPSAQQISHCATLGFRLNFRLCQRQDFEDFNLVLR